MCASSPTSVTGIISVHDSKRDRINMETDRRSHRRLRIDLPLRVGSKLPGVPPIETRTFDMSGSGIFFEYPIELEIGSEVHCEITLPSGERDQGAGLLCCTARVVRVMRIDPPDKFGIGVAILSYEFRHAVANHPEK